MTDYTIITTDNVIRTDISHTAPNEDGDCLLYGGADDGEDGRNIGRIPERRFIAAVETQHLLEPAPQSA